MADGSGLPLALGGWLRLATAERVIEPVAVKEPGGRLGDTEGRTLALADVPLEGVAESEPESEAEGVSDLDTVKLGVPERDRVGVRVSLEEPDAPRESVAVLVGELLGVSRGLAERVPVTLPVDVLDGVLVVEAVLLEDTVALPLPVPEDVLTAL